MKKTILVTGGAGFIGSSLIRHIINTTNHNVINIDKLSYSGDLESLESIKRDKKYFFEKIDICNRKKINHIFKKYQPDIVMHLAAESHVDKSINAPDDFINTNILGTYFLLEESRLYYNEISKTKKNMFLFHHISTDEVYGDLEDKNELFSEKSSYKPSSPYSASKASSDHLVRAWNRTYNLPTVITNCSNNYGPFQFPEKLIPMTIKNAIDLKNIPIYGDGKQVRDWLYVDDHSKALLLVACNGNSGETYNIGGYNQIENIQVVKTICNILDTFSPCCHSEVNKYEELITYVDDRSGHDKKYAINASKITSELGWMPQENFQSGIEKTVKWYLNNREWSNRVLKKT